jgi:hypothetical protein
MPLDEVIRRWPVLRQSTLSLHDDCELASLFNMRYGQGFSTSPQARGTIEHRVFAEALREMQRTDSESVPVAVALAILEEKLRQHGVAPEDRVRVPLRELPVMEMMVRKWATDNAFSIRNLIDVERRLECTIPYRVPDTGEIIERRISGQLDALIARPPDEAIVLDWKGTFGLPPEHEEDAEDAAKGLSYHGFLQQEVYGILVMRTYSNVNAVSLREFYHWRSKARAARMVRADLPRAEQRIAVLVEAVDLALASGKPPRLTLQALEEHGHWKPSPGKHCFNCPKAQTCPVDDDFKDGGIRTPEAAERAAATRQVARSIDKRLTGLCKSWVDLHGPIPVKRAKGRLVLGYRKIKNGLRFEEFTPETSDRPATREAYNPNEGLEQAMKDSVAEARVQRDKVA